MRHLIFFLIITLCNHFIFANNYSIKLKSSLLDADNQQNIYTINKDSHYLMTFSSIPSTEEKKELESIGINFLEYIPNNTYVIYSSKNLIYNNFIDYNIYSITKILPSFKIDPKISNRSFPEWAFFDNKLHVKILIYKNINLQIIEESLLSIQSFTIQNTDYLNNNIVGSLDPGDLNLLASLNYVWYIEPIDPPSYPENKTAISLHRSNIINVNYSNGKKYNGEGINVMMQDDGLVGPHIDRQGRLGSRSWPSKRNSKEGNTGTMKEGKK